MTRVLHRPGLIEYAAWREQVRALVLAKVPPGAAHWTDPLEAQELLYRDEEAGPALDRGDPPASGLRVPKEFPALARLVLGHRRAEKWPLLYRLLWRLTEGGEPGLLLNALDDDVFEARAMARAVKRDIHKMKAFVRFCRVPEGPRGEHFVAYHRSEHPIITIAASFFARRFSVLHWTILTPFGSATWLDGALTFGPPVPREQAPAPDRLEDFWKTYYASTFNPARANPRAMTKEMPRKYWSTLPEAEIIERLLAEAPDRTRGMIDLAIGGPAGGAAPFIPSVNGGEPVMSLNVLREAVGACRGCELYRAATCAVFGEGPASAAMMLVGEQPGDQEDQAGRPFVGPAGQVLDRALAQAGLDRAACYITNAVKHFKWTPGPRGKRRIHAKPAYTEVRACRPWLESELALVRPKVLVLLGSTAGQSLLGAGFRVLKQRGAVLRDTAFAPAVVPTIHPSAVLRAGDEAATQRQFGVLVEDLRVAARLLE